MKRFAFVGLVLAVVWVSLQPGALAASSSTGRAPGDPVDDLLGNLLGRPNCGRPIVGGPSVNDGLITVTAELTCQYKAPMELKLCIDQLVPATSVPFLAQCDSPIIKEDDYAYVEFSIPCRPGRFRPSFSGYAGVEEIDEHGDILDIEIGRPECIQRLNTEIEP